MKVVNQGLENTLSEKIQELQTLNGIIKSAQQENKSLLSQIPVENEQEKIMQFLKQISLKTGFGFTSLQFSKGKNSEVGLPELSIRFSTTGRKEKIKDFLVAIENSPRFLGMDNLNITTTRENGSLSVQFGVSLYSFFQTEKGSFLMIKRKENLSEKSFME
ncbi:type II secretion system protein M [Candidatus Gracilibacteria bacterium]|nr:type II secretion system protein M [Candidatus Gracilibacteria bacterium]